MRIIKPAPSVAPVHGEPFIRAVAAYDVSCLMEYKGLSLHDAMNIVVNDKLG